MNLNARTCLPLLLVALFAPLLGTNSHIAFAQSAHPPRDSLASFSVGGWGLALADRDSSVKAGDNFYLSQNGRWFVNAAFSAANPVFAYWRDVQRLAPRRTSAMLEAAARDRGASPNSDVGKAGAFYRAWANRKAIDEKGLTPLEPQLHAIHAVHSKSMLAALMGREAGPGTQRTVTFQQFNYTAPLFALTIGQDARNPSRYAVGLAPAGLLLPGPEYYSDPKLADIKAEYERYIARVLMLLKWEQPAERAREIVALETRVAAASLSLAEARNSASSDTVLTVSALSTLAPDFDWHAFLSGAELRAVRRLTVAGAHTLPVLARIFAETPLPVWQARQAFAVADINGGSLSDALYHVWFDFRVKQFNSGANVAPPRNIGAGMVAEASIGDILGRLYVTRYCPPDVKAHVTAMAIDIKRALDARLSRSPWMSAESQRRARAKIAALSLHVGYPDAPRSSTGFAVSDTDFFGNIVRAREFFWREQVRHLNDPYDRTAWKLTPQTATYGYTRESNSMEAPASLLEGPFYDPTADPAINYGAIGVMMGAQMVAALDDRGRHFTADGRLAELFTPDDARRFAAMRQAMADQYSLVEPLPGIHVQGHLVADEAIDDLGGILVALDAYHASLGGKPAPVIDGFTGDQRFFLGMAQMWRAKFPPPFVRAQTATGANAPPFLRVNGPVRHVDAWYAAFHVAPGDSMYVAPEHRIRLW